MDPVILESAPQFLTCTGCPKKGGLVDSPALFIEALHNIIKKGLCLLTSLNIDFTYWEAFMNKAGTLIHLFWGTPCIFGEW